MEGRGLHEGLQCSGGEGGYMVVEGRGLQGSGGEGEFRLVEGKGLHGSGWEGARKRLEFIRMLLLLLYILT